MRHNKWISIFLLLVVLVGTAGCTSPTPTDFPDSPVESSMGSSYKYYFSQLDITEKNAYNAILEHIETFPDRIEIPVLTKEQLDMVYTALIYDNPQYFFLGSNCSIRQTNSKAYFFPNYIMRLEDYSAMMRKCTAVAADILKEAGAKSTAFEKELLVHDRLIARCEYNASETNTYRHSIYGVLCGGSASCEGYAKTAKYLLDSLEIPCYVVIGTSTPPGTQASSHMWNIVQLNENWYHLDLTWDDPVMDNECNVIHHTYFNVTDEQIRKTHSDFESVYSCTAIKYNYYVHEHLRFSDFGEAERERVAEVASDLITSGSEGFTICFANEKAYQTAQKNLFENEGIYDILTRISELTHITFATDRVSYICTDESYTMEFFLVR